MPLNSPRQAGKYNSGDGIPTDAEDDSSVYDKPTIEGTCAEDPQKALILELPAARQCQHRGEVHYVDGRGIAINHKECRTCLGTWTQAQGSALTDGALHSRNPGSWIQSPRGIRASSHDLVAQFRFRRRVLKSHVRDLPYRSVPRKEKMTNSNE